MAYDDAGDGDAVVLVHSGVADRRMWQPQWDALTEQFRVVRGDLRGFGATPMPAERYSNADDVAALMDHVDVDRAAIVGSSLGGRVALELATTHPARVARLVLLCSGFRGLEPTPAAVAFDEREGALAAGGDIDRLVELNVETWLGPEAGESAKDLVREMQRHAIEVQLAAESGPTQPESVTVDVDPADITCPTVVVSGGHDMDHFQLVARHLGTTMPRARLVELDWAGHLPSLERPAEMTQLLIETLTPTT